MTVPRPVALSTRLPQHGGRRDGADLMDVHRALARLEPLTPRAALRQSATRFCHELIQVVADLCCTRMNSMYFISEDERQLVLQAAVGLPKSILKHVRKLPLDAANPTTPCAQAVLSKQVVVAPDLSNAPSFLLRKTAMDAGIASMWSHPLVRDDGQVIGTLATYYTLKRSPTRAEVGRVGRIVREAVCAVESYSAFMDTFRHAERGGSSTPLYYGMLRALLLALELRDYETIAHSRRVVTYALLLASQLGLDEGDLEELAWGAALHDVGKIGVPDTILRKPGRLTNAEFARVKAHPVIGQQMLRPSLCSMPTALSAVRHHHERFDGHGYPDGLSADRIPLSARILSIADAFDVMTTERPYSPARSVKEAREEIVACRGTQFCPRCVDAFIDIAPGVLEDVRAGRLDLSRSTGLFQPGWARNAAATVGI